MGMVHNTSLTLRKQIKATVKYLNLKFRPTAKAYNDKEQTKFEKNNT